MQRFLVNDSVPARGTVYWTQLVYAGVLIPPIWIKHRVIQTNFCSGTIVVAL